MCSSDLVLFVVCAPFYVIECTNDCILVEIDCIDPRVVCRVRTIVCCVRTILRE